MFCRRYFALNALTCRGFHVREYQGRCLSPGRPDVRTTSLLKESLGIMATTSLRVNGQDYDVPVDSSDDAIKLLWVLRHDLGLTGTKFGCGLAQCGACTVHLDGEPIR